MSYCLELHPSSFIILPQNNISFKDVYTYNGRPHCCTLQYLVDLEANMKLIKCTLVTLVFLFELPSISSDCGCTEQLGVEDGTIPSDKLTASSAYEDYPAEHGRLNTASGWIPEYLNQFQWIQADLDDAKPVIGLVTQGLNDGPLWVTLYKVNWRNNDTTFHTVLNENGTEIFKGNTDQNTEVTQMFQSTIYAQFIRIYPMEWHINIALRFELLGPCSDSGEKLGVEDGRIPADNITASSVFQSDNFGPDRGRLNTISDNNGYGAWVPSTSENSWIQADLGTMKSVIGVVTQGRSDFAIWVTSYNVLYSNDGTNFEMVKNKNGSTVFIGNTDQNTEVTNFFESAINAQLVRISPISWQRRVALRFELLGPCPDIEGPNVFCPDDMSQTLAQGQSTSSATWNNPAVNDNVDFSLIATCSPVSGSSFSVGSTPVICSAKDTAGNTGSCTFNVTVKDEEIPNVICPSDISKFTVEGTSTSSATWGEPRVIDNFDPSLLANCSPASGTLFGVGLTTVNCTAEDTAGNTGSCTFSVEVIDTEFPTVTCSNDIHQTTAQGHSTSTTSWNDPTVTDNVDGSSLSVTCSPVSGSLFSVGSTPVLCSAKDTAGNTGSCTFNVTVKDEEIPNVICPYDISKFTVEGESTSSATWREPTVIDNVDPSLSANCSPASGTLFSVGSTTVNCTAEDTAGNTGSCTFNVEVIDTDIPTVICPNAIKQTTVQSQSTSSATWNDPTVTDNVDHNLSANCTPVSGSSFSVGKTTVTCWATDTAEKTGSCTFIVEVEDIEFPTVTCPNDIHQTTAEGHSTSTTTWNNPTVTDNVNSNLPVTCSPVSGSPFSVGSTPVICSAKDAAGNTGSCTFNVTVKDEEIPNVICPSDISKFTVEGKSTSSATWREPTVIDNVDPSLSATCSHASGTLFGVGLTTVNCTAEDTAGNTGSCTFNVQVIAGSKTITGRLTIVRIDRNLVNFTADYDDPTSDAYQELALLIIQALTAIFRSANGFLDIQILNFQSGSIIVDYDVMLKSTGATASDLDLLFSENVNDVGELSGSTIYLDPESIQILHEFCPDNYCKNGGTCFMDMDDFESHCTCTESYKGETCNERKLEILTVVGIFLAVLGSCFLIIGLSLICRHHMLCGGQPNSKYKQAAILKKPMHLNRPPRFGQMYYDNNVPQENIGGRLKHNCHFLTPYVGSGNELAVKGQVHA